MVYGRETGMRPTTAGHTGQVLAIYKFSIDTGQATFEGAAPDWKTFDRSKLPARRRFAMNPTTDAVRGRVAVSKTSESAVYAGVLQHSLYVRPKARGVLRRALFGLTEAAEIWTMHPASFPRTPRPFDSTRQPASARLAPANVSDAVRVSGAIPSSSSD